MLDAEMFECGMKCNETQIFLSQRRRKICSRVIAEGDILHLCILYLES